MFHVSRVSGVKIPRRTESCATHKEENKFLYQAATSLIVAPNDTNSVLHVSERPGGHVTAGLFRDQSPFGQVSFVVGYIPDFSP